MYDYEVPYGLCYLSILLSLSYQMTSYFVDSWHCLSFEWAKHFFPVLYLLLVRESYKRIDRVMIRILSIFSIDSNNNCISYHLPPFKPYAAQSCILLCQEWLETLSWCSAAMFILLHRLNLNITLAPCKKCKVQLYISCAIHCNYEAMLKQGHAGWCWGIWFTIQLSKPIKRNHWN